MNKEYEERIKHANDAAEDFFDNIKRTGNMGMLQDDSKITELYLQALDVTQPASEEERDFYINFSDYYVYKGIFLVITGEFAKRVGNKRTFTIRELQPLYDELTSIIDEAIEQNDKYKPDYLKEKDVIISNYNEVLEKHGFTIKKDGCYIATAVYGSYDCPQVWVLRRYRDNKMASHFLGRMFIGAYYSVSPVLVKWFGNKKWFIHICRKPLDAIVCKLLNNGYEDTPCDDFILHNEYYKDYMPKETTK